MERLSVYILLTLLLVGKVTYSQSSKKIKITVCITGNSKLHIKGGELTWENLNDIPPGECDECTTPTVVNGKLWMYWRVPFKLDFNTDSLLVDATILQKNEISQLIQAPTAENGWETIWWFHDPSPMVHNYSVLFELKPVPKPVKQKQIKKTTAPKVDTSAVFLEYIPNNITFGEDNSVLTKESMLELDKIYESLKISGKSIEISGHTNNGGEKDQLLKLSEERAKAVYIYLSNKGLSKSRMSYRGYGDTRPIAPNTTIEGRLKNRRVEIKVKK